MAESARHASAARYRNVPGENVAPGLIAGLAALGAALAVAASWSALTATAPASAKAAAVLPIRPVPRPAAPPAAVAAVAPVATAPAPVRPAQEARPLCPDPVSILFPSASATPLEEDVRARVGSLIAWLAEHPRARVQVQGHADAVGADQTNLLLSYQRAKAAAALLAQAGVAEQRIAVAAVGSHELVAGLPRDAGAHRRATLAINDPDGCRTPASSS